VEIEDWKIFLESGLEEVMGTSLIYLKFGCVVACHMREAMKAHDGAM